jgi:hypothetical protein
MPFTYRIDSTADILFLKSEGVVTQPERLETLRACTNDPGYGTTSRTLMDVSTATSVPTFSELRELVGFLQGPLAKVGPRRVAIVALGDVSFGVARQFQALLGSAPASIQVFRNEDEALEWLR